MTAAAIAQAGTVLSVIAFLLMARAYKPRQYFRAWLAQFCAQPFWIASTLIAQQWVMVGVSIFFTLIAMHGVMRFVAEMRAEKERIVP